MRSRALLSAAALAAECAVSGPAAARDAGEPPDAGVMGDAGTRRDAGADGGILLTAEERALLERPRDAGAEVVTRWPRPSPDEKIVLVREAPPSAGPASEAASTGVLLRTVVGLVTVVGLAYLAAQPRLRALERRLGMLHRITAGLGFVLIGVIAREAEVFTPHVLEQLTPVMQFGLGWLGFQVGYRFDVRTLDTLPAGTARAVSLATAFPLVSVALACGSSAYLLGTVEPRELLISALALGLAGAISTTPRSRRAESPRHDELTARVHQLDEIASVIGLAFLSCYVRPEHASLAWELPGTVWLFIVLGMGLAIGMVVHGVLGLGGTDAEFLAVSLGSIAFASGMAGFLHVSPLVVCFVAGALVTNLPFSEKSRLAHTLSKLQPAILLSFLTLAGAFWDYRDPRGWLLLPAFVFARFAGKWLAALTLARSEGGQRPSRSLHDSELVRAPMSALSIAVVLSVESLYGADSLAWTATAVIAGALALDFLPRPPLAKTTRAGDPT